MMICMEPSRPTSSPVPESGITITLSVEDSVLHGAVVLEEEGAGAAGERAGDAFDGDIAAGAFDDALPESISPLLVASRSPWNCLSMEKRPTELSSDLKAGSRGRSLTSKEPVACWVMVVSFCWVGMVASRKAKRASESFINYPSRKL